MPIFVKNLYSTFDSTELTVNVILKIPICLSKYIGITSVVVLDMCYYGTVDRISAPYLVKQSLHDCKDK